MAKPDLRAASERLRLRPLELRDLPITRAWRNASRSWFEDSSEISKEGHLRWFWSYLEDDSQIVLMAEDRIFCLPVGQAGIRSVRYDPTTETRTAEFGRLLVDPNLFDRGIATEMLTALVKECRREGILTLWLNVFSSNAAAIKVYQRCGFHEISRTSAPKPLVMMMRRDWELWNPVETDRIDAYWASDAFEREHRTTMAREAIKLMDAPGSILEVGCGSGRIMEALISVSPHLNLEKRLSGCDVSPAMLDKAKARFPGLPLHQADVFNLPFQDKQFDVVLAFEVLSHLPSIRKPLLEMMRVANQKIIFTVWQVSPISWASVSGFMPIHKAVSENDVLAILPNAKPVGPVAPSGVRLWECSR